MPFEIIETETFAKRFESLDKREQAWVRKTVTKLAGNPFTGKPLHFEWFREKKFEDKRLYYLIYPELRKVLIAAFGDKKGQQRIIDTIIRNLDAYKTLAGMIQ
ncbi:MAG TPA: hypothetical protein HA254_02420 [Candidatus Diapherotrites archaeon]|uniref:Type II toxin-antitoxin system RelE/ParE family toxin n=1 Tax=Candidatus Iainarchaeum sp. TaxID=3101447 RepID=A0A7J4IVL6_9ARCH|nr:hypothetical protein [Candidatus Diapherotrites archaeon]